MTRARTSIDVVIPSIRFDMERMLEALQMDMPPGVDVSYYVISDNRSLESKDFEYMGRPARLIVNDDGLGAPLSRNVGLEAGSGRYILFIDDDVRASPDILSRYLEAVREEPEAPGYIGPTLFPEPVNPFTRGILSSGMLTFFHLPGWRPHMLWGTTSNLMVRRDAVGDVRFSDAFPKHGGGEDIDFCLRIFANAERPFKTVADAVVRHPWWGNGRRSYTRFFRWATGDSRLVRLHPQYVYRDVPSLTEALAFGAVILGSLAAAGLAPVSMLGVWAAAAFCSEVAVEGAHVKSHHPESSIRDMVEASIIRLSNEAGRFLGPLSRRDVSCILARFDILGTGEWLPMEKKFARAKFALFLAAAPLSYLASVWI